MNNIQTSEINTIREGLSDTKSLSKQGFKITTRVYRLPADEGIALRKSYLGLKGRLRYGFTETKMRDWLVPMYDLRTRHKSQVAQFVSSVETAGSEAFSKQLLAHGRRNYVSPFGGETCVTVETPSGHQFVGRSICSITDIFNSKTARDLAYASLIKNMYQQAYAKNDLTNKV